MNLTGNMIQDLYQYIDEIIRKQGDRGDESLGLILFSMGFTLSYGLDIRKVIGDVCNGDLFGQYF